MDGKKIIEVNGIKMELDMRTATVSSIETFKVGDSIKVLVKSYSDSWTAYPGVIAGFDAFKKKPTITVAYVADYGELKYAYFHEGSDNVEIIRSDPHDLPATKKTIMGRFDKEVSKAEGDLDEAKMKRAHFQRFYGKFFSAFEMTMPQEIAEENNDG